MAQVDKTLTVEEAAAYLGVSVHWMYALRRADAGPRSTRPGRRLQYSKADLDLYLAHRRQVSARGGL